MQGDLEVPPGNWETLSSLNEPQKLGHRVLTLKMAIHFMVTAK